MKDIYIWYLRCSEHRIEVYFTIKVFLQSTKCTTKVQLVSFIIGFYVEVRVNVSGIKSHILKNGDEAWFLTVEDGETNDTAKEKTWGCESWCSLCRLENPMKVLPNVFNITCLCVTDCVCHSFGQVFIGGLLPASFLPEHTSEVHLGCFLVLQSQRAFLQAQNTKNRARRKFYCPDQTLLTHMNINDQTEGESSLTFTAL